MLERFVKSCVVGEARGETDFSYGGVGCEDHFACFLQSEIKQKLIRRDVISVFESVYNLIFRQCGRLGNLVKVYVFFVVVEEILSDNLGVRHFFRPVFECDEQLVKNVFVLYFFGGNAEQFQLFDDWLDFVYIELTAQRQSAGFAVISLKMHEKIVWLVAGDGASVIHVGLLNVIFSGLDLDGHAVFRKTKNAFSYDKENAQLVDAVDVAFARLELAVGGEVIMR